jgi:hypothetical protein
LLLVELIVVVRGVTAIYSAVVEFTGTAGDRAPNLGTWDEEPSSTLGTTLELVVAVVVLLSWFFETGEKRSVILGGVVHLHTLHHK